MYRMAKEYYSLLKKGQEASEDDVKEVKNELDKLEGLYSGDVAYYAFLEMERIAVGLGRTKQCDQ
jgi:hypothetical protein